MNWNDYTVFWFRRDLRLEDNHGLYKALSEKGNVVPIFIFDKEILDGLPEYDARVTFIYEAIALLKKQLETLGSSLMVFHATPEQVFSKISPKAVYTNHDYEPYAIARDQKIRRILSEKGSELKTFKDQVIFERNEVLKNNGDPYTVFTPYSKRWKLRLSDYPIVQFDVKSVSKGFAQLSHRPLLPLEQLGFVKNDIAPSPVPSIPESILKAYNETRDYPGINGTSKLSVHLRFGTISIRKLVLHALNSNETYLNELIWREFYMMILYHFPQVVDRSFKPAYDAIPWQNDAEDFERWKTGNTGIAMVDAGMRELNATGYMHNRVRMIVASFLTKNLLIDWRWGEAYFAEKLLDYELSSNNGGWQWAAGCGCDAAPYFRVFNPDTQALKFDPQQVYIRKWVPEFQGFNYWPMVDLKYSRQRAIDVYKQALR